MKRDSYSGPCTAVVEEAFSPDGTWPKGWGLGTSPQFTTNSGYFSTPLCDYRMPACLHAPMNVSVTIGNQDAKWLPGAFNTTFAGTSETDWKPVTSYYASMERRHALQESNNLSSQLKLMAFITKSYLTYRNVCDELACLSQTSRRPSPMLTSVVY